MAVNLSPVGGVAAQFFTNTGAVLTGGKLFTYLAGTTTPAVAYTSSQGTTAWSNPIVLDAAGRVPSGGEIWITDGITYKFVLKDSNDVLIATYDNISGINSNFLAFTSQQQIITATANQTVFNLSITYQPGTNSLSVFVDGVNQYGPGAQYAYTETDADTVTFVSGLHVGAQVKFTTTQQQGAGAVDASQVSYVPPFTGSVPTNVEAKLAQYVNVMDFGAVGNGTTNDFSAIQAANNAAKLLGKTLYFPGGVYGINATAAGVALSQTTSWVADNDATILRLDFGSGGGIPTVLQLNQNGLILSGLTFDGQVTTASTPTVPNNDPAFGTYVASGDSASETFWTDVRGVYLRGAQNAIVENCTFKNFLRSGLRVDNQFTATQSAENIKINKCKTQRNRGIFGDGFYFGGVIDLTVSDCTAYDFQRIGFVTEFGAVAYSQIGKAIKYSNCFSELGHDGIAPESNYGFWDEVGTDIMYSNCVVHSAAAGFLASGGYSATDWSYTSNHAYVNCSATKVYMLARLIGADTNGYSSNISMTNCFGQVVVPGSTLAPPGTPSLAGTQQGIQIQASMNASSKASTFNLTNLRLEMIDFGTLAPANTEFGGVVIRNTDTAPATARQFVLTVSGLQTQWLTAAGARDTGVQTVFETCTSGKFGDITAVGLNDFGGAFDYRTRAIVTVENSCNVTFGYIMGAFQLLSGSSLAFDRTNVCLRRTTGAGCDGFLKVTNAELFDYRGNIRFDDGWNIDNCVIKNANSSSVDRTSVTIAVADSSLGPRKISNCEIERQIRFQLEGGATLNDYILRLMLINNRFYIPFNNESGLYLAQGIGQFASVMLSNNAFVNNGTGSMAATAEMIECAQPGGGVSAIQFTGAGNAFDAAMVTAGGHVVQVNTTPTYNDAPQTIAAPFNTVLGALVQFKPI
jgi:hypothetical protein